jgi:hypothetical protein
VENNTFFNTTVENQKFRNKAGHSPFFDSNLYQQDKNFLTFSNFVEKREKIYLPD